MSERQEDVQQKLKAQLLRVARGVARRPATLSRAAVVVLDKIVGAAQNATTFEAGVDSDAIRGISYNPISRDLTIMFTGNSISYLFRDVPADVIAGLLTAQSAGAYYHANIKGRYQV